METNLAYLAGIVDGEGSVELKMQRKGTLDLILHVFNSDTPLFDWIVANFGGKRYDIHRRYRTEKPQWAPVYNWNIGGQGARDLLEQLVPHLIVKRAQAEHAVQAWDDRRPVPRGGAQRGRARVTEEILAHRRQLIDHMHLLNRKNRPGPPV